MAITLFFSPISPFASFPSARFCDFFFGLAVKMWEGPPSVCLLRKVHTRRGGRKEELVVDREAPEPCNVSLTRKAIRNLFKKAD